MKSPMNLERTMLLFIVGISSLVTAVLTLASLVLDYRSEFSRQKDRAVQLQESISRPLGSLLYNGDEDLIAIYVQSVLANREVACIEIEDFYAKEKSKKWCDKDSEVFQSFDISYPINFDGFQSKSREQKMESLGLVRVKFSDRSIIDSIKERILTFFVTQALKTFIVSFFILLLMRRMVMEHVRRIYYYFRRYESDFKGKALTLEGKRWTPEFDELTQSINIMVARQEQIIGLAAEREHYYQQLAKVFYPHQLDRMSAGEQLETTMPVGKGQATVIAFDLVGSSQLQSTQVQSFLRQLIASCNEAMMKDYDHQAMTASAYRIKVMGDGFLCSVGYPFKTKGGRPAPDVAVELARNFIRIAEDLSMILGIREEIYCGIGIASGEIETFFPDTSPSEYDVFGRALIHATRYESCRRLLFEELKVRDSIIVLQSTVYETMSKDVRKDFVRYSLDHWKVRDDVEATCLYYQLRRAKPLPQLSVVS